MGLGDFLFGSEGTPGEHGIDYLKLDEYDDYPGIREDLNQYYGGILEGKEPGFFEDYIPGIQKQEEQALDRYYLGDPGDRGNSAMGLAGQIGAQTGVGPKATFAQQGKVGNELAAKKTAARAAWDKYRVGWMGDAQFQATAGLQNQPRTPSFVASGYNIDPGAGSEGFLQGAAKAWAGGGFQGASNLMNLLPQGGGTTTTTTGGDFGGGAGNFSVSGGGDDYLSSNDFSTSEFGGF